MTIKPSIFKIIASDTQNRLESVYNRVSSAKLYIDLMWWSFKERFRNNKKIDSIVIIEK